MKTRLLLFLMLISLANAPSTRSANQNGGVQTSFVEPPSLKEGFSGFQPYLIAASDQTPSAPEDQLWVVRAYYSDRQMLIDLASWIEPWEVHPDQGYLVVGVTPLEYERMRAMGFRLEIDQRLTQAVNQPHLSLPGQTSGIPGYPCYRTVEETYATAEALAANYPDLATWVDIGDSWDKLQPGGADGYDLMVLRLTNSQIPGPKPKLFAMGSVHAREYPPAEILTRFAEGLLADYGVDPDVTWILDYHEIHLLLQANPDGRKQAEAGLSWRKNTDEDYCTATPTRRGADLNRNFEFQWACCGGSSSNECNETYHGASAASEPEVQAIQAYLVAQFPDQRGPALSDPAPEDAVGVFVDLHTYGGLVMWPWGFGATPTPNDVALTTLGRKMAYFNAYTPVQITDLYPADGNTVDFAYGDLGLAAYGMEMGTAFFEDCTTFENDTLPDNLPVLDYLARIAGSPYREPAGPDALSVAANPITVTVGAPISLTATIDDTLYNQSNGVEPTQTITSAVYTIDVPPWITATAPITYSMTAIDGAFESAVEAVGALVDTGELSEGRHTIFVRGRDADGNWGPVSAAFIYIVHYKFYLPAIYK